MKPLEFFMCYLRANHLLLRAGFEIITLLQTLENGKVVTYFYRLIELGFDETAAGLKEGR